MQVMELIGGHFLAAGFTLREAVTILGTIYNYTVSFSVEQQAVFPRPGERSPRYNLKARNAKLDAARFPLLRKSGSILFNNFDRRYADGLALILKGASA